MLLKSPKIILLGYPRPSNSYFLDMELSYKGVVCYSFINPIDQKEVIKKHKNATLVIFDLDNDKNTVSYILESADTNNKIICFSQQEIMNTGLNKIMFLLNEKYLQDKMLECEIMISRLVKLIRYSSNNNYQ